MQDAPPGTTQSPRSMARSNATNLDRMFETNIRSLVALARSEHLDTEPARPGLQA